MLNGDLDATSLLISSQIIEKMNGQGEGAEVIPFSVAVKAHGNIEEWLCDLLFKMQVLRSPQICDGTVRRPRSVGTSIELDFTTRGFWQEERPPIREDIPRFWHPLVIKAFPSCTFSSLCTLSNQRCNLPIDVCLPNVLIFFPPADHERLDKDLCGRRCKCRQRYFSSTWLCRQFLCAVCATRRAAHVDDRRPDSARTGMYVSEIAPSSMIPLQGLETRSPPQTYSFLIGVYA